MSQHLTLTGSDQLELFYKEKFYFSYSSINKLLFSPVMFYKHYVLFQREDSVDAHLIAGRVLHCLLLEPDNFDKQFLIMPSKLPTGNNKQIVDDIFKYHMTIGNNTLILSDYSQDILTQLLTINLHQSLKTDQQRLAKILTEENKEYFEFLKKSQDKTVVDQGTLDNCKISIEVLKANLSVRALIGLDVTAEDTHIQVENELLLKCDVSGLPFGYKGILDNVVVDSETKTIFINDLKTTGKAIQDFPEAVIYYKYWIQAVIYKKLAIQNFLKALPDVENWKVMITFIVIDKYNQVYPYQVSLGTLAYWEETFSELEQQVKWHYENRRYDLPYELAIGNVKL